MHEDNFGFDGPTAPAYVRGPRFGLRARPALWPAWRGQMRYPHMEWRAPQGDSDAVASLSPWPSAPAYMQGHGARVI